MRRTRDTTQRRRKERPHRSRTRTSSRRFRSCASCTPTRRAWQSALEKGLPISNESWRGDAGTKRRSDRRSSGRVSELTLNLPFADGGAKRLRGCLQCRRQLPRARTGWHCHDMRFVFLTNDTKLLFATAYDGEWDAYIDDFATKVPRRSGLCSLQCRGVGRGIHGPKVKDWNGTRTKTRRWPGTTIASPNLTAGRTDGSTGSARR
jgi:hypothetical protein